MNCMSEEIRERLTILETKHEERHGQTLLMLEGISNTQKSLVDAVQQIAINQGKMEHMGGEIDEHGDRIGKLEVTQGQHKIAIGGLLFLSSSLLTAGIGMIFGWFK